MRKSLAFGAMHVGVAFSVGYVLTGSISVAGAMTVVEPVCNTIAHYFFDRWWDRRQLSRESSPADDGPVHAGRTRASVPITSDDVTLSDRAVWWRVPAV